MENQLLIPAQEKEAGTAYWQQKDYFNASKSYSKALLAINHLMKEEKFETQEQILTMINEVQLPCLLNLSACYLKQNCGYSNVVNFCTDALKIQDNNVKALYRRAIAYTFLDKFKEAEQDIDRGLLIDPENPGLLKARADLGKRRNAYLEKTKKIARKTFGADKVPTVFKVEESRPKWWKCSFCRRKAVKLD